MTTINSTFYRAYFVAENLLILIYSYKLFGSKYSEPLKKKKKTQAIY